MQAEIICPQCKSNKTIPILYGEPTPDDLEAEKWGELELAEGEDDGSTSPNRRCLTCGYAWRV